MKVIVVAGARPNFIKVAALFSAFRESGIRPILVHTGQHNGSRMSDVFFEELDLSPPDHRLFCGEENREEWIAGCCLALERIFRKERPDRAVVVGDVNSTLAGAQAAARTKVPLAHVEAGLRSFDRTMPEEINRIETDKLCDVLFATEAAAVNNLVNEGFPSARVRLVGNVLIDTLDRYMPAAVGRKTAAGLGLGKDGYGLLTMHRPGNVDSGEGLESMAYNLDRVDADMPILFPVHPRTRRSFERSGTGKIFESVRNLRMIDPQGYIDFLSLLNDCRFVLTDSGGIQDETTALGVPCLTLRDNTERPVTIEQGSNRLVGAGGERLVETLAAVLSSPEPVRRRPDLWDGQAAKRVVSILLDSAA